MKILFISLIILIFIIIIYIQYKNRDKFFIEILNEIPKNNTVLDFGGGNCELKNFLKGRNNVKTIDITKGCVDSDVYDGHILPYNDKTFDIVVSSFVLHHIPHNIEILKELERVCKNKIIIIEDYPDTFISELISKIHFLFFYQPMSYISNMKHPEEWIKNLNGKTNYKLMKAGSFINPTKHYIIINELSN
jgi:ubiquinone/menaquinone biosynthesis C-methylase UbiE